MVKVEDNVVEEVKVTPKMVMEGVANSVGEWLVDTATYFGKHTLTSMAVVIPAAFVYALTFAALSCANSKDD